MENMKIFLRTSEKDAIVSSVASSSKERMDRKMAYLDSRRKAIDSLFDQVQRVSNPPAVDIDVKSFFFDLEKNVKRQDDRLQLMDKQRVVGEMLYSDVLRVFADEVHNSIMIVPLPPTRHEDVSGQEKLCIDVALALPYVRDTDVVTVVGSYSEHRGGQAYKLLIGHVAVVNLYDSQELSTRSEEYVLNIGSKRTIFNYYAEDWPPDKLVTSEVFFNDAIIENNGVLSCLRIPTTSRVYSLKRFFGDDKQYDQSDEYHQIRHTGNKEWREVFPPRPPHKYSGNFGDCVLCRELSYFMTSIPYKFKEMWAMVHLRQCSCAVYPRKFDGSYVYPDLGIITPKKIFESSPSHVYLPYVDMGDKVSRPVGEVLLDDFYRLTAIFSDFEYFIKDKGVVYGTISGRELPNFPVPKEFYYENHVFFSSGKLNFTLLGNRVFSLVLTRARKQSDYVFFRQQGSLYFCSDPGKVSKIIVFFRGVFQFSVNTWESYVRNINKLLIDSHVRPLF